MTSRQFLALVFPLVAVIVGWAILSVVERSGGIGGPEWDDSFARRIRSTMAHEYVGGTNERRNWEAYFNSLNSWVRTFDRHAEVVPPWELEDQREQSSGRYAGIGVRTEAPSAAGTPDENVEIIGVKPGGPAAQAGVRNGDRIIGVDGKSVAALAADGERGLTDAIRGIEGTPVVLQLRAPDGTVRDATVTRRAIDTGSVFGTRVLGGADGEVPVGYVRLSQFLMDTADGFREQLTKLKKQGMRALVLDLRNNRGGLLPQAIDIADALLDAGVIVKVRGRSSDFSDVTYASTERTLDATIPLAVLVDRGSASASEVLAGALQDHRRALVVGERTYGKFLVQTVEEIPMEIGTAVFKRTTALYESPQGHNYQRIAADDPLAGIEPDVAVTMNAKDRERLGRVFREEMLAEWNTERPPNLAGVDPILDAAVSLLRGVAVTPALPQPRDT